MVWLINAAQLDKFRKNQKNIIILDASWYLPTDSRDAKNEFLNKHIVGARFIDLDLFHDNFAQTPNMLLRDEITIQNQLSALGITNDHKIIFYDNSPLHTSCRALWMLKVFGHNPNLLYILDGNIDTWQQYGGKTEIGESRVGTKPYIVHYQTRIIRSLQQMKSNYKHPLEQVVDVRHPVRYAGGSEPRVGIRAGHIPGSYSFPYFTMFESDGRWKPIERIRKQLISIGLSLDFPIITMCGSGMTAAILNFALDLLDYSPQALYDGSWAEWGAEQLYVGEESLAERPVVTCID